MNLKDDDVVSAVALVVDTGVDDVVDAPTALVWTPHGAAPGR
jgi:hypothetical protein